jgi:hypothetical protein
LDWEGRVRARDWRGRKLIKIIYNFSNINELSIRIIPY